ncbi:MAG: ABC transporter ATP-binding protein [Eubacterium sp.]|nr:ABC transporter ATP-binding protein [Eubacterium sp.]
MLSLSHVTLKYRKKTILQDVSFDAAPGQTIGLLGMNGSGKSTLLLSIAGVKKPAEGTILLEGKSYADDPRAYNSSVGFVTQENALIDELTAMDNLRLWTPMSKAEIFDTLQNTSLCALGVHTYLELPVNSMSGGMKKRLSLATVLINKPNVLLMDEPFAALDLVAKKDILNFLSLFRSGGGITVIASHDEKIFEFCDESYLLKDGVVTHLPQLAEKIKNGTDISELLRR